ncbi:hypothetical protein ACQPZF_14155 [Actinosynnema sp. CS-041913]
MIALGIRDRSGRDGTGTAVLVAVGDVAEVELYGDALVEEK